MPDSSTQTVAGPATIGSVALEVPDPVAAEGFTHDTSG
jgi:hypothetical protein